MSSAPSQTFTCPHCAKRYTWKPQFAGRKISCGCGKVFEAQLGLAGAKLSGELYGISSTASAQSTARAPTTGDPIYHFNQAYPRRKTTPAIVAEYHEEPISFLKDRAIPLTLIVLGVAGRIAQTLFIPPAARPLAAVALVVFEVIVNCGIMLVGAYLAAEFLAVSFGSIGRAALKLLAIALFTGVVAAWVPHIDHQPYSVRGMIIALQMVIIFYFGFFYALFELDLQEALTSTVIIGGVQGLVMVGLHAAASQIASPPPFG